MINTVCLYEEKISVYPQTEKKYFAQASLTLYILKLAAFTERLQLGNPQTALSCQSVRPQTAV